MNLGQWLGQWAGRWFGDGEELPPGFMRGAATLRIDAAGTLLNGAPVTPQVTSGGGRGFLPEKKPRRDTDDDLLMCFLL